MIELGKFYDLDIYIDSGIIIFDNNKKHYYNGYYRGDDLCSQLFYIKSRSGKNKDSLFLMNTVPGRWYLDYHESGKYPKFRSFIFNNKIIKEFLLLKDILE